MGQSLNGMDLEALVDGYLEQAQNPEIVYPDHPCDGPDVPELLRLAPQEILGRLAALHSGYRVTLNLTDLKVEEVLELLYDCQGMITRLEIFNLKDYSAGKTAHLEDISRLMQAINEGSVIHLKQVIREIIHRLKQDPASDSAAHIDKLTAILYDIDTLKSYYSGKPLDARIGSDSTGRSPRLHGMGLAIRETLPRRARKEIRNGRAGDTRETIPMHMTACKTLTFVPAKASSRAGRLLQRLAAALPLIGIPGSGWRESWPVETTATRMANPGNIVTLGGVQKHPTMGFCWSLRQQPKPAADSAGAI